MRQQEFDKSPVAHEAGKWPKLAITPTQEQTWGHRRTVMLWTASAYADIWYALMTDKDGQHAFWTDQIDTAATDDKLVYFNPKFYFSLDHDEAAFVNCHEEIGRAHV